MSVTRRNHPSRDGEAVDRMFAPVGYATVDELVQGLDVLITRAQVRSAELVARKAERVRVTRMRDLLGDAGPTPSIDPSIDPPTGAAA